MTEKELIKKIQELRQIEPRKDWVIFTKERILGEEFSRERVPAFGWSEFVEGIGIIFQHKFAFASLLVVMVFVGVLGTFSFAQNSLPGDSLYSLKRITEKSQAVFVSEEDQPRHNLEIVNRRLDDLTKVAESNRINNLSSAIKEFKASISEAAKSLTQGVQTEKDIEKMKGIVVGVKELEEKVEKVKSLGIEIGENEELDNALAKIVEREIEDLGEKSLTEEQEESLAEAIKNYEEGDYSQALEKIWFLSQ